MNNEPKPLWAPQPSVEDEVRMYEEWIQKKEQAEKQKNQESPHVIIIDI